MKAIAKSGMDNIPLFIYNMKKQVSHANIKKFLHYYKPHKAMLIFDLIYATIVSLVDISFPQILNVLNKSLFTMDATVILHTIGFVAIGLIVMYLIKLFCDYFLLQHGDILWAPGWKAPCAAICSIKCSVFHFLIMIKIIQAK